MFRAGWENRDQASYAWRILNDGVCDGCALGTKGLHDWTLDGIHLCNIRLRLLRLNTMREFDGAICEDVSRLERMSGRELRALGRIPYPMLRRRGDRGFSRITWDEALDLSAERIREAGPERIGFYLTSRGMPNESYYAAQKAARAMGTNSVDNAARVCHSPSTFGLKEAVGVGASTCSFKDWIGTDLVVFIGSNIATNQPVATKYVYQARKAGTRIVSVNPFREPGMDRYWIPSNAESAVFGTKIADDWFGLNIGGDVAFFTGVLRHLIENDWVDKEFIRSHTEGWDELRDEVLAADWEVLEAVAGAKAESMLELARLIGEAKRGVLVWSMGVTQHAHGEHAVRAILNLGLARGWVGKPGCGLMPIRGHSGVQGGAEMGCYSTNFPGGAEVNEENAKRFSELWGFEVPWTQGLRSPEMLDAAHRGELDVLFSAGGNFLDTMPDPDRIREALERTPLRIHMDIVLSKQMFAEPGEAVLVLPATTRYEIPGGVTETSTERRVILSPEIPGPRIEEARPEWDVMLELAARVRPEIAGKLRVRGTHGAPRRDRTGQPALRADRRPPGGWRLVSVRRPALSRWDRLSDAIRQGSFRPGSSPGFVRGARRRDARALDAARQAVQLNRPRRPRRDHRHEPRDGAGLGQGRGEAGARSPGRRSWCEARTASFDARVHVARIAPGNAQVHWPEGNVLIADEIRSDEAGIPDYNARVTIEAL